MELLLKVTLDSGGQFRNHLGTIGTIGDYWELLGTIGDYRGLSGTIVGDYRGLKVGDYKEIIVSIIEDNSEEN